MRKKHELLSFRWTIIILVLLVGTSLMMAKVLAQNTASVPYVKIGFLLPLGDLNGQQARQGGELALQVLNEKYKGVLHLEPRWEDSRSEPKTAGSRMEALAADSQVLGVIGPINSGPATAAADVANRSKVVLISPLASTPALAKPDDFFFRTWPSDATEAKFMAEFAWKKLKLNRIFVLSIGAAYGQALAEAFSAEFVALGGQIVEKVEYPGDTQIFDAYVTRIRSSVPEALYYVGYPPDMAEMLRALRSRQMNITVLSAAIVSDPSVVALAGKNVEGVIFPFPKTYEQADASQDALQFRVLFKDNFNQEPGFIVAQSYDSVMLLARAIIEAKSAVQGLPSRLDVQQALKKIGCFDGATGNFCLDTNGDAIRAFNVLYIKDGKMVPFQP